MSGTNNANLDSEIMVKYQQIFLDWYNLLLWAAIPIYALFSFLFNRKAGYNYAEHVVMQAYQLSALNILSTLILIMGLFWYQSWVILGLFALGFIYYLWILSQWIDRRDVKFFIKNIVAYLLGNLAYFIMITMLSVVLMIQANL